MATVNSGHLIGIVPGSGEIAGAPRRHGDVFTRDGLAWAPDPWNNRRLDIGHDDLYNQYGHNELAW